MNQTTDTTRTENGPTSPLPPLSQVVVYGLGAMGRPMARNLHQHGLLRGVKNRTEGKAQALRKELNLPEYNNDAALFADADCVVTCVAADDDLKAVVNEIRPLLRPGAVIIDSWPNNCRPKASAFLTRPCPAAWKARARAP